MYTPSQIRRVSSHTYIQTYIHTYIHTKSCIIIILHDQMFVTSLYSSMIMNFALDPGVDRFKFALTMRDSPSDYVNVTCWGSEAYIRSLVDSFKICDVGEITLPYYTQKCHVMRTHVYTIKIFLAQRIMLCIYQGR